MYTEAQVIRQLRNFRENNYSLRDIARLEFGGALTYGDVQRALKGHFPKDPHKRFMMGIPAIVETPACPECGQVHKIDGVCIARSLVTVTVVELSADEYARVERPVTIRIKRRPASRPRASINLADPESAARTIRRKMDAETLALLVELLKQAE